MPENEAERDGYNFIDLFAGAGGLSEGFIQAGFNPVTHVEMNEFAARTLTTRTAYYYLKEEDNLNLYYRYLRGEITRDEFLAEIPDEILDTVICETLSKKTIPGVFQIPYQVPAEDVRLRECYGNRICKRGKDMEEYSETLETSGI